MTRMAGPCIQQDTGLTTELYVDIGRPDGLTKSCSWELSLKVLFLLQLLSLEELFVLEWNLVSTSPNVHKLNLGLPNCYFLVSLRKHKQLCLFPQISTLNLFLITNFHSKVRMEYQLFDPLVGWFPVICLMLLL